MCFLIVLNLLRNDDDDDDDDKLLVSSGPHVMICFIILLGWTAIGQQLDIFCFFFFSHENDVTKSY